MRSAVAVAAGAWFGASARWWVGDLLVTDAFPWATLLVNVIGCAAVGWVAVRVERRTVAWHFLTTGCLGGFTTASAFAVETRQLVAEGRPLVALAYAVASIGLGLAAVSAPRSWALRRVAP